jgi:hypothetical protein
LGAVAGFDPAGMDVCDFACIPAAGFAGALVFLFLPESFIFLSIVDTSVRSRVPRGKTQYSSTPPPAHQIFHSASFADPPDHEMISRRASKRRLSPQPPYSKLGTNPKFHRSNRITPAANSPVAGNQAAQNLFL